MKKVALISDGWKRLITYAWVDGIMSKIHECGEDICLHQYNCYGNWSHDELHNKGEYNIYTLPDLSEFDGIILDCNNIVDKEQLNKTIKMLRESGVPVVSIGYDIEGFYYAGMDNRSPITEMMEHLYNVHGCRKFVFAGGPEDNYENSLRVETYLETLKKFNLNEAKNPYYYGDYDYYTGVRYYEKLVKNKKSLPDVFICANDNIAAGLCAKAQDEGYNIPEDFMITGYDNLDKAAYFSPQITTVSYEREDIGQKCMEILLELWKGNEVDKYSFVPAQCIFTESCGCQNSGAVDYRTYIKNQITYGVKKQTDDEELVSLEGNMSKCDTYEEIFEYIGEYFSNLECDGFSIILDKKIFDADIDDDFIVDGYDINNLNVSYSVENGQVLKFATIGEFYKYLNDNGSGNAYMYTPIHFREYAVGFTVMKNGRFLYDNPYFYDIHSTIVRVMENLYKQKQLEKINVKLKNLYNRDPMTGVYNRIAYGEIIQPEFEKYNAMKVPCAMAFMDVNHFKKLNDTMGHDYGDQVLKHVASTLEKKCPDTGYVFRFGGDEFVIFYPYATEESVQEFKTTVKNILKKSNIYISMGTVITECGAGISIDGYMALADKRMYEEKMRGKDL